MSIKIKKTKKSSVTANKQAHNQKVSGNQYADARESITAAIYALGDTAKSGDVKARESIANLSVILFDLQ